MAHVPLVDPQIEVSVGGCRGVDHFDGALGNRWDDLDIHH